MRATFSFTKINVLIFTLFLTTNSLAVAMLKGVNYDPNHSFEFAQGVGMDDTDQMKKAIENDFDRLYQLHKQYPAFKDINHIKTFLPFYISSGTHKAAVKVDIAEVVNDWNQKHLDDPLYLAVGMRERNESPAERALQVDAIVNDVKKYNHNSSATVLIDRIIVGSEDMQDRGIPSNIIEDVSAIKSKLQQHYFLGIITEQDKTVKIGTAQIPRFAMNIFDKALAGNSEKSIGDVVDFIGINPYPFLEGEKCSDAVYNIIQTWINFESLAWINASFNDRKEVIITEEGWPSDGGSRNLAVANFADENSYFVEWNRGIKMNRMNVPVSYYFSLFDKLPDFGIESHWGIFGADGAKSILDDKEVGKPLDSEKKHILVDFVNTTGRGQVALHACLQDFESSASISTINAQCYPIYGSDRVEGVNFAIDDNYGHEKSDDDNYGHRKFMVDAGGNIYKSLVVYSDQQPLCYIPSEKLINFKNNNQVQIKYITTTNFSECNLG